MAIAIEHNAVFNLNLGSYYTRITGANNDVAVLSFVSQSSIRRDAKPFNPFFLGTTWGATNVGVQYTLKPDFDKDTADDWQDHPNRAAITTYGAALEGGQIAALRFAFSGDGMVEMWSPVPVEVID